MTDTIDLERRLREVSRNELRTYLMDANEGWLHDIGKVFAITLTPAEHDYLVAALVPEAADALREQRERIKELRNAVLEEAAKVCDKTAASPSTLWEQPRCWMHSAENCAAFIRALKSPPRE